MVSSLAQRKMLSQQKTRRTKEVQEELKGAEEAMGKLKPITKTAPDWLDDYAVEEWDRIMPLVEDLKIKELDRVLLATYCQTYSNYKNATLKLKEQGLVIETERGTKLSSYYTVQRDSVNTMNSICPKLGLTVESRLKILAPSNDKEKSDPFEELMDDK